MWFNLLHILLALVALLLVVFSLRLLFSIKWFTVWIKSSIAIIGLATGIGLLISGIDLFSYSPIDEEEHVATLSVRQLADQRYRVSFTRPEQAKEPEVFELQGDQWQLDVKVLIWEGLPNWFGQHASYRLDRLSGRYLRVEDEMQKPRSVHALKDDDSLVDLWQLASEYPWLPGLKAKQGMSSFLPLHSGAVFEVKIGERGLIAYPANAAAQEALAGWQ